MAISCKKHAQIQSQKCGRLNAVNARSILACSLRLASLNVRFRMIEGLLVKRCALCCAVI